MPFEFLPTETFLFWLGRYETIGRASLAFTASASLQFYCSRGTKKSWANNQHPPSLNLYWKGQNKSFSEGRHGSEDFALWTCVKLRKTSSRFDLTNWFTCALINEHFSGFSLYIAARFLRSLSKELGFFFIWLEQRQLFLASFPPLESPAFEELMYGSSVMPAWPPSIPFCLSLVQTHTETLGTQCSSFPTLPPPHTPLLLSTCWRGLQSCYRKVRCRSQTQR